MSLCPEEVALLAGEGDTAVLFSLGGAGERISGRTALEG